jgi:hypothetical protein
MPRTVYKSASFLLLLLFFFFFVGLEFELRTLYHLSHTFNPFCSDYFGDGGVSHELFAQAGLELQSS